MKRIALLATTLGLTAATLTTTVASAGIKYQSIKYGIKY